MSLFASLIRKLQQLFKPEFAAGAHAEQIFEELCCERNYTCMRIEQDRASYRKWYARQTNFGKRGDYLIRGFNVEIEVKCRTAYGREEYQYLSLKEIKAHRRNQQQVKNPVVFAFFVRKGRRAVKESLRMIALDDLTPPLKPRILQTKSGNALRIPRSAMVNGFDLLEKVLSEQSASSISQRR